MQSKTQKKRKKTKTN